MAGTPAYICFVRPVNFDTSSKLLEACNQSVMQGATELHIAISSPGGQIIAGFGAYNHLRQLPVPIITYNIGSINSISNVVFLSGEQRIAASNSTFLFHGTSWNFGANADIALRQLKEVVASLEADEARMRDVFLLRTKLSAETITQLMAEGATRDANFAQQFGVATKVEDPKIPAGASVVQV
jgi:ATP-dependent protease ClpP protease subunit